MILLYTLLAFSLSVLGFVIALIFSISNTKFTEGQFKKLVEKFMAGTILMYAGIVCQFLAELLDLVHTPFEFFKYSYMFAGFLFFFFSALDIYRLSKVIGFSEKIPKRLKTIIKA